MASMRSGTSSASRRGICMTRGMLAVEHGFEQGAAVRELFAQNGFVEIYTERDLEGRERVSGGFIRK